LRVLLEILGQKNAIKSFGGVGNGHNSSRTHVWKRKKKQAYPQGLSRL